MGLVLSPVKWRKSALGSYEHQEREKEENKPRRLFWFPGTDSRNRRLGKQPAAEAPSPHRLPGWASPTREETKGSRGEHGGLQGAPQNQGRRESFGRGFQAPPANSVFPGRRRCWPFTIRSRRPPPICRVCRCHRHLKAQAAVSRRLAQHELSKLCPPDAEGRVDRQVQRGRRLESCKRADKVKTDAMSAVGDL